MHGRFWCLAALMLTACHSGGSGGAGAHGATSSSATAQASAPNATASTTAATTSGRPAMSPAPPTGDPSVLKLASGATLTVPGGASAAPMNNAAKRLPGVVMVAHKYQLGSAKRLLLVNEMDREGLACKAVLDRELDRANKAKTDDNEQRKAMRQMTGVKELKIGGHRALYAESQNRAPTPGTGQADTTKPTVGVATLIMCRGEDYVVMMHAGEQAPDPAETKKLLVDIAASYKPAG